MEYLFRLSIMNLRKKNYPPRFWIEIDKYLKDLLLPPPPRKSRPPTTAKTDHCLTSLCPHIQKLIFDGATDKRKGENRSGKLTLNSEQYSLIEKLGSTRKYKEVLLLEQALQLEYTFEYKGYIRAIEHIQFRLQQQKSVIVGKSPALLLRLRFHQKAPVLIS